MKKLLAICLTLAMTLSLFACANSEQPNNTNNPQNSSGQNTANPPSPGNTDKNETPNIAAGDFDAYPHPAVVTNETMKVGYLVQSRNSEATHRSLN